MSLFGAVNWVALLLFSALILVIAVFGLSLSGHFPAEHRKPELQGHLGRLILVGSILAVALAAAKTLGLAAGVLPPAAAIIGAGAALLAAPLVLARLSNDFVNGRVGLLSMAALASVLGWLTGHLKG